MMQPQPERKLTRAPRHIPRLILCWCRRGEPRTTPDGDAPFLHGIQTCRTTSVLHCYTTDDDVGIYTQLCFFFASSFWAASPEMWPVYDISEARPSLGLCWHVGTTLFLYFFPQSIDLSRPVFSCRKKKKKMQLALRKDRK
jgi:hypothetical protein